ncbi:Isochorismatase hydrolase [Ilyonectria robusta]
MSSNPAAYSPSETAVLLLDYHTKFHDFIQPTDRVGGMISTAEDLVTWARESGLLIIHCLLDVWNQRPPNNTRANDRWDWVAAMVQGDPKSFREHDAIAPPFGTTDGNTYNELTFIRRPGQVSALHSTGLREVLATRNIKHLVLGGMSTGGCVFATARSAVDEGFVASIVEAGCADPSEAKHKYMFESVFPHDFWVFSTAADLIGQVQAEVSNASKL